MLDCGQGDSHLLKEVFEDDIGVGAGANVDPVGVQLLI